MGTATAAKMEILAPAGDADMLRAAVFSGADCVYLGVKGFNARRTAENFEGQSLAEAVAFCHARNCGVYAAVNTLALPGREQDLRRAMETVAAAGCDAVIVQDMAAMLAARTVSPSLPVHASTQMSVHSAAGVEKLAEMGFSRVILARELNRDEIAEIAKKSPIELEVFVHGALCVSVSGQCYMSAFLGGRSANRGACAGPCRLPFAACAAGTAAPKMPRGAAGAADEQLPHHLSLKDLSILDALPELEKIGVVSAKIEGRLRGPEYCAVITDAAKKALAGQDYVRQLVQDVFSRQGFTDGWYTGKGAAFGARSQADAAAGKKAQPKARQLYRRELPRVPVEMELTFGPHGGRLRVADGQNTLQRRFGGPLPMAEKDNREALQTALAKTGGTPFYLASPPRVETGGAFLPGSEVANLRRDMLEELLSLRQKQPQTAYDVNLPQASSWGLIGSSQSKQEAEAQQQARQKAGRPLFWARFEHVAQVPKAAAGACHALVLPLWEAQQVPAEWREKTWLWLPRALFGPAEAEAARRIATAQAMGFAGFEADNIAHLKLCEGLPTSGGFGLNVANSMAAATYATHGCRAITLSPELSLRQMEAIVQDKAFGGRIQFSAIGYGHFPLMMIRACPLQNVTECAKCGGKGKLYDRINAEFSVACRDGVRTVYNPVPIWMGDRLQEIPTQCLTLYFTTESPQQAAAVLQAYQAGQPAPGPFTRGLFTKGTGEG